MTDLFDDASPSLTSPLEAAFAVTPNDTNGLSFTTRELYVGQGGDIALELKSGDQVLLQNVPDGARLAYRVAKILATGTTASAIVGLY